MLARLVDDHPFQAVHHCVRHSYASDMRDLAQVVDGFAFLLYFGLDLFVFKIPVVDILMVGSNPLVSKWKIEYFGAFGLFNDLFSSKMIIEIPKRQSHIIDNGPNPLLLLTKGKGQNGKLFLQLAKTLRLDLLAFLEVKRKYINHR